MSDYQSKRVVVTGCASGIGAATARALGARGARVVGLDLVPGDKALDDFIVTDLSRPEMIDDTLGRLAMGGPVDALFNCAGLPPTQPKLEILKVNFLGTRHLSQGVASLMSTGGAIVSVSSNGGLRWRAHRTMLLDLVARESFADGLAWLEERLDGIVNGYAFAKQALTVWTLYESSRLIARGVRLNCTSPGAVQTPMLREIEEKMPGAAIDAATIPIGRRSSPEEQVTPLLFLGSQTASYVNGVDLAVDGGFAAMVALGE